MELTETPKTSNVKERPIDPLIQWLMDLAEQQDRARLAALRRGLTLEREQLFVLFGVIPRGLLIDAHRREETERRFIVASLFALHPCSFAQNELQGRRRSIGDSMRLLALRHRERSISNGLDDEETISEPLKRRMDAVLSSRDGEVYEHLRHIIRLLKTEDIPVDWDQLLRDLRNWNHVNQFVQWRWSEAFYVGSKEKVEGGEENVS